jgi:hypothetical protein
MFLNEKWHNYIGEVIIIIPIFQMRNWFHGEIKFPAKNWMPGGTEQTQEI